MDEKKLEQVTGGGESVGYEEFFALFEERNCKDCAKKMTSGCLYRIRSQKQYNAFRGDPNAVCPERVV